MGCSWSSPLRWAAGRRDGSLSLFVRGREGMGGAAAAVDGQATDSADPGAIMRFSSIDGEGGGAERAVKQPNGSESGG